MSTTIKPAEGRSRPSALRIRRVQPQRRDFVRAMCHRSGGFGSTLGVRARCAPGQPCASARGRATAHDPPRNAGVESGEGRRSPNSPRVRTTPTAVGVAPVELAPPTVAAPTARAAAVDGVRVSLPGLHTMLASSPEPPPARDKWVHRLQGHRPPQLDCSTGDRSTALTSALGAYGLGSIW